MVTYFLKGELDFYLLRGLAKCDLKKINGTRALQWTCSFPKALYLGQAPQMLLGQST